MNTDENTTPARKYKRYDEAFKRSAVEHWMLSGKSARLIAAEFGVNEQSLHQWKQQFKGLPAGQVAGTLYLMNDDLSAIVGEGHGVAFEKPPDGSWTRNSPVQEGASLFKRNGIYYLGGAGFYKGRYSSVVAMSTNIFGPYNNWEEAVPCGGGTDYFQDKEGNWWDAYFGNDNQSPFREKPAIVKVDFDKDGKIFVAKDQPAFVLQQSSQF